MPKRVFKLKENKAEYMYIPSPASRWMKIRCPCIDKCNCQLFYKRGAIPECTQNNAHPADKAIYNKLLIQHKKLLQEIIADNALKAGWIKRKG